MRILIVLFAIAACAKQPRPVAVDRPPDFAVVVENETAETVGVFLFEQKSRPRLGVAAPNRTTVVPVANYYVARAAPMRLYLFRGPEPCPVARMVDFRYSRTPRITVTTTDTVVSAYLPGDACRVRGR